MTKGIEELKRDLDIISAMSQDMDQYLNSDVLFWPMTYPAYPQLTLGSYLMRLNRLQILTILLDEEEQSRLVSIDKSVQEATRERIVQVEQKAGQELGARIRQWEQHVQDFNLGTDVSKAYYKTDVQIRVIITVLIQKLQTPPYQLDSQALVKIGQLDDKLKGLWQPGEFVWPIEWIPAYPKLPYWWLYGLPILE
ncbi:MAG: hypothetical protein IAF02_22870 [Anaerolineae bacterium]|nr:hypothetical protein [Anaerolineae bacterium]